MASLSDLPELVGFFSYSRDDDADSLGALTALRTRIQGELRGLLGRTAKTFRLWQDKEAIPSGALWETEIKNAVGQAVFFIPIITPTVVASPHCRFELQSFLAREAELGRADLVFPILYIEVPALEDAARRHNDPVLSLIAQRQYANWSEFRFLDMNSPDVRRSVGRFCADIRNALNQPWMSPQERRQLEEDAARQQAEAERQRQEAEDKRRADEQTRQRNMDEQERQRAAEAERRAVEAAEAKRREEAEAERRRQTEAEKQAEAARQQAEAARLRAETEARARQQAEATWTWQAEAEAPRPPEAETVKQTETVQAAAKQSSPAAAWLDVKSWSYAKIAVVGAALGLLGWLANQAGLYAAVVQYAYLLEAGTAIFVATLVFFATRLRGRPSAMRLLVAFFGLYVLEFVFSYSAGMIDDVLSDRPMVERLAVIVSLVVLVLAEWLLISASLQLPRDTPGARAMPAVAAATGALRGLVRLTTSQILPAEIYVPTMWAFEAAVMAVMLSYGSGKPVVLRLDAKTWSYLKIAIVAAAVGLIIEMTMKAPIQGLDLGSTYLVNSERALYVAAFLTFAAAMTFFPSARRCAILFFALYLIETMLVLTEPVLTQVVEQSACMLIEWLFVAFCFLSLKGALKDWKMLGVALAVGAVQGMGSYPADPLGFTGNVLLEGFDFATTALCLAYGIRRHPMTANASPAT